MSMSGLMPVVFLMKYAMAAQSWSESLFMTWTAPALGDVAAAVVDDGARPVGVGKDDLVFRADGFGSGDHRRVGVLEFDGHGGVEVVGACPDALEVDVFGFEPPADGVGGQGRA